MDRASLHVYACNVFYYLLAQACKAILYLLTHPGIHLPATDSDQAASPVLDSAQPGTLTGEPEEYQYSSLPDGGGWIRLLRLLPARGEKDPLRCQLVDYNLSDPVKGSHPYEALSYVWGRQGGPQVVLMEDGDHYDRPAHVGAEGGEMRSSRSGYLTVTRNLEGALRRLRSCSLDRILWIDALCINQKDVQERGQQVQLMARIYASARQVLVWLEEETGDPANDATDTDLGLGILSYLGEHKIDQDYETLNVVPSIHQTLGEKVEKGFYSKISHSGQGAIRRLLDCLWFRRIWVLQEVAAARRVVMLSRSVELDGYAFCLGLDATFGDNRPKSKSNDEANHEGRGVRKIEGDDEDLSLSYAVDRARSAASLIRGSMFRPSYKREQASSSLDQKAPARFSLGVAPLSELVQRYYHRQATDRRDRIFALLGMCSDDLLPSGLLPDYTTTWSTLIRELVWFVVQSNTQVWCWNDSDIAILRPRGLIVGIVKISDRNEDVTGHWIYHPCQEQIRQEHLRHPTRQQDIYLSGILGSEAMANLYPVPYSTLLGAVDQVESGDFICVLEGASTFTIIRRFSDFWFVTAVGVTAKGENETLFSKLSPDFSSSPNFLLVWDLSSRTRQKPGPKEESEFMKYGYTDFLRDRLPAHHFSEAEILRANISTSRQRRLEIISLAQGHMDTSGFPGPQPVLLKSPTDAETLQELVYTHLDKAIDVGQVPLDRLDRLMDMAHLECHLSRNADKHSPYGFSCSDHEKFAYWYASETMRRCPIELETPKLLRTLAAVELVIRQIETTKACYYDEYTASLGWMADIVGRKGPFRDVRGDTALITLVRSKAGGNGDPVRLLLARHGHEVEVTEAVLKATVSNNDGWSSTKLRVLLDHAGGGGAVDKITRGVFSAIFDTYEYVDEPKPKWYRSTGKELCIQLLRAAAKGKPFVNNNDGHDSKARQQIDPILSASRRSGRTRSSSLPVNGTRGNLQSLGHSRKSQRGTKLVTSPKRGRAKSAPPRVTSTGGRSESVGT